MTKSIIQPEYFLKTFCRFDKIAVQIGLMSFSIIIVSTFECGFIKSYIKCYLNVSQKLGCFIVSDFAFFLFQITIIIFFSIRKPNSSKIVLKDKVSDLVDCHIFYSADNIQDIHDYNRKTKNKKILIWMKNRVR